MEMIMSTISNAPAVAQDMVEESTGSGPLATLTRWSVAYITWRTEQAAIAQLWSMTDRELKDIGLTRSQIRAKRRATTRSATTSEHAMP
jgi:uncharacterized protein YjiS (DUF1127 family)